MSIEDTKRTFWNTYNTSSFCEILVKANRENEGLGVISMKKPQEHGWFKKLENSNFQVPVNLSLFVDSVLFPKDHNTKITLNEKASQWKN